MDLSKRLNRMIEMLPGGTVAADIGCDHAYASIALVQCGKYQKVIASDVRKGPLESAKKNIEANGLSSVIETRLYDGLQGVKPGEADSILIAGMGGVTMRKILEDSEETAKGAKYLLLQPQSEIASFRAFLRNQGYQILEEDMIFEDGKYYPMMLVTPSSKEIPGDALEDAFGPQLLQEKNPVLLEFLLWKKGIKEEILTKLPKDSSQEKTVKNREETENELRLIQKALALYNR